MKFRPGTTADDADFPCQLRRFSIPATLGDAPPAMRAMFRHDDHHGLLGNPLMLGAILGREPLTLRAYFEELATEEGSTSP